MSQGDYKQDVLNGTNGHQILDTGAIAEAARLTFQLTPEAEEYVANVEAEIASLGAHAPLCRALAERELARIKCGEITEHGYLSIHKDVPIKVVKKVLIPSKDHPTINFVGRLLGPKGATLKGLQASTRAKILIFGRGSMWDKTKEEEARNSGDPKYAHLTEDLHVFIEITAYPAEVQARLAHVLTELKKFLDPSNPGHFTAGGDLGMSPIRPPPGLRGPPPPGYRPRPPMGAGGPPRGYGAPPRPAAPVSQPSQSSYDTTGYYGGASAESSYQSSAPPQDTSNAYGYASYPAQSDYSAPANSYENEAARAQQYAQQQQQQQQQYAQQTSQQQPPSYSAQPSAYGQPQTAQPAYGQPQQQQPAYGQPQTSPYAQQASYGQQQPVYAAAASAPSYGGYPAASSAPRPQFGAPAAKKPRLSAPYGSY